MPEGCGWKTSGGRKDEDERNRWEARRCHFGKGEEEKQVTQRRREKKCFSEFSEAQRKIFCENSAVTCLDSSL